MNSLVSDFGNYAELIVDCCWELLKSASTGIYNYSVYIYIIYSTYFANTLVQLNAYPLGVLSSAEENWVA